MTPRRIKGYVELAPPQLLDDKWRELTFDLASDQNILQDLITPEAGGGYVYREAHIAGSATHNRYIYWRTFSDVLELVEISTEKVLDGNQVKIKFSNSSVISSINVIEFSDSIVLIVATSGSVHHWDLQHPKLTNKSILHDLKDDVLFNSSNYYILNTNHTPLNGGGQQPICATSWHDKMFVKCALSFPDSSLLIVQFSRNTHQVTTSEIKQTGIIGRLWSRMPNLLARNQHDCDNAVFYCASYNHPAVEDVLLFTLCRDWKIRVFSTSTKECVHTYNVIPQSSFSQSFASHHTANITAEQPMMKMFGSHIVIYLTENQPEFVVLKYTFEEGVHQVKEVATLETPHWEKLIDFSLTKNNIWALANARETESTLCYINIKNVISETDSELGDLQGEWTSVNFGDDFDMVNVKNHVAEIFWRNRFSVATIQKALVGIVGPSIPKNCSIEALEEIAHTRIVDGDQVEAWTRFYNYCLQNHHTANKSIGLVASSDECLISIIKRSNPSFICPWLISSNMILQAVPYRGIKYSSSMRGIIEPLDYIATQLLDDELKFEFEQKLLENPSSALQLIEGVVQNIIHTKEINLDQLNFNHKNIISGIGFLCEQLDLSQQAEDYNEKVLQDSRIKSNHNPLESNSGIATTFELFKRIVRGRMSLARDLLLYIHLINARIESEKSSIDDRSLAELCEDLFTSSKVRRILDSLRSYAVLVWITETPVKSLTIQTNQDVIEFISTHFRFFKDSSKQRDKVLDSSMEVVIHQNLFMNFLINGGVELSTVITDTSRSHRLIRTLSNSFYVTEIALNLCLLLWPKTNYLCFAEYLFTNQDDEHLDKYLNLTEDWLGTAEFDRHFMRGANYLLQKRATNAVDIFSRIWMNMTQSNLMKQFIGFSESDSDIVSVTPILIYRYYEKLTQLFQLYNNNQCLVMLINNCISLLDGNADQEQQDWINRSRAKLFQYYLELEDPDEAYHTMVLTTDTSLRTNCLRKFIVHHCEKEQWANLLTYPFIDINNDFLDILKQKAESSDLSKLNGDAFYKTSYYDLLFSSYVSDDEFRKASDIMYSYAQRLAHEVPGIISIRKQADCLLIALNALRCVDDKEAFIGTEFNNQKEEGRSSVMKRAYDCETDSMFEHSIQNKDDANLLLVRSKVTTKDIEMKYELTRARLKLLEKDQTANAIALSPLNPQETIDQLVASSMYSTALDLALLFKSPMEPILEGLTAKFIFIMRLSTIDIAVHQDLERGLTEIFTSSYSNIDTYNYVANSSSTFAEKLWRLIEYYLVSHDGISHRYSTDIFSKTFAGTTVLMRIVANKLLSSGYDIPASLKRMYMSRNTAELLKLLIKYDRLACAADLAVEMIDRVLEPSNCFVFTNPIVPSDPPPVYLPTHLILLLISFLNEDATDKYHTKIGANLTDRLGKFRHFVETA